MLVDTGAWNNLVGSECFSRMDKFNSEAGILQSCRTQPQRPVRLGGVGKKTQLSTESVTVPTTVSVDHSTYKATVIEGSHLPALLGLNTLKSMNAILDLRNDRLILPKHAGDAQIKFRSESCT